MTRICSKHGPRYPVYNDKQGRSSGCCSRFICWEFNFAGSDYLPAPRQLSPPLPRPTLQIKHLIKQPKATMGFVRGNRTFKKGFNYETSN